MLWVWGLVFPVGQGVQRFPQGPLQLAPRARFTETFLGDECRPLVD